MSNSPTLELRRLFGWTTEQLVAAIRQERETEDVSVREAALRILARARAGKPTYAQLEVRIVELEAELAALKTGTFRSFEEAAVGEVVGYMVKGEARILHFSLDDEEQHE